MKERLAAILERPGVGSYHMNTSRAVQTYLESEAKSITCIRAAKWTLARSPRAFLERQPTGARFSMLSKPVQNEVLGTLETWAVERFGSLDAIIEEQHEFKLKLFKF
jgi:hypothetical protein